jgi:hypothetical protein
MIENYGLNKNNEIIEKVDLYPQKAHFWLDGWMVGCKIVLNISNTIFLAYLNQRNACSICKTIKVTK